MTFYYFNLYILFDLFTKEVKFSPLSLHHPHHLHFYLQFLIQYDEIFFFNIHPINLFSMLNHQLQIILHFILVLYRFHIFKTFKRFYLYHFSLIYSIFYFYLHLIYSKNLVSLLYLDLETLYIH
jgi:hypothetical protein